MEFQREEKKEKRKKRKRKSDVQIFDSSFRVDENEDPKTCWDKLAVFLSRWKAPGLKTIGRLSHVLYNSKIPGLFRHEWLVEAIAVLASGDQMVAFRPTWEEPDKNTFSETKRY